MTGLVRFVYDFVIGDDPLVAAVVVVGLGLTAAGGSAAWWVLPCAVLFALAASVVRATRRHDAGH